MQNESNRRLSAHAAAHHGVFTRREARTLGISDRSIERRTAAGRYLRVEPGVYRIAGAPDTTMQRIAGVVASFPALAAVSHGTAAELWGLTTRGIRAIEVVTTRWDRVRRRGIKVHESLDLIPEDVVERNGVPITTPARTVVDLGASSRWLVESAFEAGLRLGLYTQSDVEAFVARVARRGRRGVGVIRPVLELRRRWSGATDSELEAVFRRLMADAGIPDPESLYVLRDDAGGVVMEGDCAYPGAKVLIELDSERHHLDSIAFRRDRSKTNKALMLGWIVLRYTWWDLIEEPGRVCSEVRAAITRAGV